MQVLVQNRVQNQRVGQQPQRGQGQNRASNARHGQRALGQCANQTNARQPALVYATRRKANHDATNIIAGTFTINSVQYFALINVESTHSYVSCLMADKLGVGLE